MARIYIIYPCEVLNNRSEFFSKKHYILIIFYVIYYFSLDFGLFFCNRSDIMI